MLLIALPRILLLVEIFLSLICLVPLDQTPKIQICDMVASVNHEVIEGIRQLLGMYVLDSEEAYEDGSIDNDGTASDEEDESGLGEAVARTCVNKSVTEEVEEVQRLMKYTCI